MKLRTGRKVGRTLYRQVGEHPSDEDPIVGIVDTPKLAAQIAADSERVSLAPEGEVEQLRDDVLWAVEQIGTFPPLEVWERVRDIRARLSDTQAKEITEGRRA